MRGKKQSSTCTGVVGKVKLLNLPSGKLTWQWKMDLLKMYSPLNMGIFHCHVSLLEGTQKKIAEVHVETKGRSGSELPPLSRQRPRGKHTFEYPKRSKKTGRTFVGRRTKCDTTPVFATCIGGDKPKKTTTFV